MLLLAPIFQTLASQYKDGQNGDPGLNGNKLTAFFVASSSQNSITRMVAQNLTEIKQDLRGITLLTIPNASDSFFESLRRRLNIVSDNPVLVLTDNMNSDRFLVLRLFKKQFLQQFKGLGCLVEQFGNDIQLDSPDVRETISSFVSSPVECLTENGESLFKNYLDALAVFTIGVGPYASKELCGGDISAPMEWVRNELSTLKGKAETYSSDDDEWESLKARERFSDYRFEALHARSKASISAKVYCLNNINHHSYIIHSEQSEYERLMIRPTLLRLAEKESTRQLGRYNRALYYHFDNPSDPFGKEEFYKDYDWIEKDYFFMDDYSDEGRCLGLIVEEEVNASIVQLIRECKFGIEMPRFFRKYDDIIKHKCDLKAGSKTVSFNFYDRGRDSLRPIPLGDVNASIKALLEENASYVNEFGVFSENDYLFKASKFTLFRNYCCHTGSSFSKSDFLEMRLLFMEIIENYLDPYCAIKQRLKGKN